MNSILLSFVGQQDPFAKTNSEGSIVTLIRHLIASQHHIQRVLLLHTSGTAQNAHDTQQWLLTEVPNLTPATIVLLPVNVAFSQDPVDPLLASQAARQALQHIAPHLNPDDWLEFNASSGTPAMKTAWSVLQAAGYAPRSRVWQVRNPKEMQPGQERVFFSNVNSLKTEFDLTVIRQQVQDYNYSGALTSLNASTLATSLLRALLESGRCRLAMDYDRAHNALNTLTAYTEQIDRQWLHDLALLRQNDLAALTQEAYFNALTRRNTRHYSEFLIMLFAFLESALRCLVSKQVGLDIRANRDRSLDAIWHHLRTLQHGQLHRHLIAYRLPNGTPLRLDGHLNRIVMTAILEFFPACADLIPTLQQLNQYVKDRNDLVHALQGVSEIPDEQKILTLARQLLKRTTPIPAENPFDRLNQQISILLDRQLGLPDD